MGLKDTLFLILIIEKYLSTEMSSFMKKIFSYKMAHNYAFDNQEKDENIVQRDLDFLKKSLDHNIDNNNIETEIDRI